MKTALLLSLLALTTSATLSSPTPGRAEPIPVAQQNRHLARCYQPETFGLRSISNTKATRYEGQTQLLPNQQTTCSFATLPLITLKGNTPFKKLIGLIDTSSNVSWLMFKAARKNNAYFIGPTHEGIPYTGSYNLKNIPAYAAVIRTLQINNLQLQNTPFYIPMTLAELPSLTRGITQPEIQAILGYNTLVAFKYIQFDFPNNQLHLSTTQPYTPNPDNLITTAKIIPTKEFGLAIQGTIEGQPTPLIIDVAGDFHFTRGDIKTRRTATLSWGSIHQEDVPTLLIPPSHTPPRLGRHILKPYRLTICPDQGVVHFETPPNT